MSGTDYASQLLGPSSATPPKDYASELLGGKTMSPSVMNPPVESESKGAGFGAMVKANMVDDPQTRMRIYAKSRFPNLPEKDALDRYGVIGGDIVYLDTDGKVKKESPSGFTGFLKDVAANVVGQAPSVIGGTVGAIAGAPVGPAGAAGGAALGAAGGKGISQVLGNLIFDEPQTASGNAVNMATEGGINAATTYLGSKLAQKIGERAVARDISKLDRAGTEELVQKGRNIGVDLNAAEATNLPSLKSRYEVLGRLPSSMDIIDADRLAKGGQAANAVSNYANSISGASGSPQAAGQGARSGAQKILDRIAEDRATAARPLYEKALSAQINPADETLQRISNAPAFQQAWERAKRIAANEGVDLGDNKNTMQSLHYVKLGLDDLIDKGGMEGVGATEQRAIIGVKNKLLNFLDSSNPDYARARSVFGHYMPTLKASREGMLGQLADLADMDVNTAARKVFNPANAPEDVRKLRSMFFRYDQGDQWNALLKSYLTDTFEQAGREFKTTGGVRTAAPTWRAMMAGNPRQLANIRASLTEPQLKGFNDMMDVFEAIGRVSGSGGSPTMPLSVGEREMRGEAMTIAAKALQPRQSIIDWLTEARMGNHAEEMARVMTSKDGIQKLKQLRQMSVIDKRFWSGFSSLFGIGNSSAERPEDSPIRTAQ